MYVEWDPENGEDKQTWNFDPGDVTRKQAMQIERHYGGPWDQWLQSLLMGQIQARFVLLWYMMSLVHPNLKIDDVPDFRVRQLKTQMGVTELKDLWERAKKIKLNQDQRDAFNSQFETDMREAMEREGLAGDAKIVDNRLELTGADDLPK